MARFYVFPDNAPLGISKGPVWQIGTSRAIPPTGPIKVDNCLEWPLDPVHLWAGNNVIDRRIEQTPGPDG